MHPTSSFGASMDRRRLLRTGGLAVSLGALAAACGTNRGGGTEPGRVGVVPSPEGLPEAEVTDVVLLRTAQSLEYTAIEVYGAAAELGVLSADQTALVERFVEDHTAHAAAVGELIVEAGGEEFTCPNPWIMERAITPILAALEGSDDLVRDVLNIAWSLETLAAKTYQDVVGELTDPALRQAAMAIGVDENRHAAVLAMAITGTPEGYVSPALLGEQVAPDEAGFPIHYAIESTFGQLGSVDLLVGARNDEGTRFAILLQTPAENAFVYDYMSC